MAFHLGCKSSAVAKKQTPPATHAPVYGPQVHQYFVRNYVPLGIMEAGVIFFVFREESRSLLLV